MVLPNSSRPWLRKIPAFDKEIEVSFCRDYRDDYLGQQATKLMADSFSDADFICHVDVDCIFLRTVSPKDLILGGRPRILMRPYSLLGRQWPWRRPTESFLGWEVSHDFMQHPPFTYPSWLYSELRSFAVANHGMDLEMYVTTRPPRGFSEFNALGAYAYARHKDRFIWIDNSREDPGTPYCRWYWTWGGIDETIRADINDILGLGPQRNV